MFLVCKVRFAVRVEAGGDSVELPTCGAVSSWTVKGLHSHWGWGPWWRPSRSLSRGGDEMFDQLDSIPDISLCFPLCAQSIFLSHCKSDNTSGGKIVGSLLSH